VNRTDYTLLAAALLFMFVLGGVTDKDKTVNIHETTVNNQSIDTDSDLQNLEITWTGNIRYHKYNFTVKDEVTHNGREVGAKVTLNRGRPYPIQISTGRKARRIEELCNHEVIHTYFPDYRHPDFTRPGVRRYNDPVYRLEDNTEFFACNRLTKTLIEKQYS